VIDEAVIREAGKRLQDAAPSAQVILFGSCARADAGQYSDLDFLVVEPDVENAADESVRLMRVLRDLRVPVDVIVVTKGYADEWRNVHGTLVHAAMAEGRVLAG
jgi:predicted nucleotidyltransferase